MKTSYAILAHDGNKLFYGVLQFYFAMPTF